MFKFNLLELIEYIRGAKFAQSLAVETVHRVVALHHVR